MAHIETQPLHFRLHLFDDNLEFEAPNHLGASGAQLRGEVFHLKVGVVDRAESVVIEIGEVTGVASGQIQDAIREARAQVSRGHLDVAARIAGSTAKLVRRRMRS